MNYDSPDGKYPSAKLTPPQERFIRQFKMGKPVFVYPGNDTRIGNGLVRAGLIKIVADIATLTDKGVSILDQI